MPKRESVLRRALLPLTILAGLGLLLTLTSVVQADTLTVTNTDDDGLGSLRQAIADAQPGDTIEFALSYPATITLTSGELAITKPLTISGPGPELLAVSGDGSSRVFRVDAPGGAEQIAVTLSGLTIRDGYESTQSGGGLYSDERLTLTGIAFHGNFAGSFGGGMYSANSSPVLTGVTFTGNRAPGLPYGPSHYGGGGLFSGSGDPVLVEVTFRGNSASYGGGMYNSDSSGSLTNVIFDDNSARYGGGMYNHSSAPTLTYVAFQRNFAVHRGGGVHNYNSSPMVTNVTFSGNSADDSGGGMYNHHSSNPALTNVTFSGNAAGDDGGGMSNCYGGPRPTLTNVTFGGNAAGRHGGGIYNLGSSPVIQNTVLWGNRAGSDGDQVYNEGASTPTLAHSDVEGSKGSGIQWDAFLGVDLGGNLDAQPRYEEPVDPAAAPTTAGNLRLQWISPVIDAGDNYVDPDPANSPPDSLYDVATDLEGLPRIACRTVDMGAYEFQHRLCLHKTAADPWVTPGQATTYTLTVYNAFTDTVMTGGVVSDTLAAGTELAGPITLDPPGAGAVGQAPPILVSNLTLNPGQAATVTYAVTVGVGVAPGLLANTAAVSSSQVLTPWTTIHTLAVCAPHVTVVSEADAGPGSLRQAIDGVCPGGTIDFALTYPATITLTGGELHIPKALTLTGPGSHLLAVSGQRASRVFRVDTPDWSGPLAVAISGLTIRDGSAEDGGGLWNGEDLYLADVVLRGNLATESGGGVYNEGGSSMLTDVTFEGNSAISGGGMYNGSGSSTLASVTFEGNLADSGGGMYSLDSSPVLVDVSFVRNSADWSCGGFYTSRGDPILTAVTLSGNSANSDGGGMCSTAGNPVLTGVTLRGNSAGGNGGGMYSYGGSPALTNVLFGGNSAFGHGGGLYSGQNSSPTLTNVTLSGNWASDSGGGVYNYTGSPTIQNSVLWGNRAAARGHQIYNWYGTAAIAHSDIQGSGGSGSGWDGALGTDLGSNLDADPRFVLPIDPAAAPTTAGDLWLYAGPATDAGNNGFLPPGVTTDLDGAPRIVNGTVDLGAYELQPGLHLYKTADVAWARPGQLITYTLTAFNAFSETLMTGGVVSDSLPGGLAFAGPIVLEPPNAGLVGIGPPILITDLVLNPGQAATVTLPVTVQAAVLSGTEIVNIAGITSTQVVSPRLAAHRLPVLECEDHVAVNSEADGGPGSLRQALASVCPGGTIDFALPVYPVTITLTSGELSIAKSLTLTGPGADLVTVSGNNTSRVFRVDGPGGSEQIAVTLSGLSICDGYASSGAGLWNDETLALTGVTFDNNLASGDGGGMFNVNTSPRLMDVGFGGNRASGNGGGIYNSAGSPTLTTVTFRGNSAYYGGGMYNEDYSNPTLSNVTFAGNSARHGGGIYNGVGSPTLRDVTFDGNGADDWGGGMFISYGSPELTNVTFSGNRAGWGGGLHNYHSSPAFANVVFRGNWANRGGGIYSVGGSPTLTNVTFGSNWADDRGGGVYHESSGCTVQNSILWDNRAGTGGDQIYREEGSVTIAWSNIQGSGGSGAGWDGALGTDLGGNIDAGPQFVDPANPAEAPTSAGDLHLQWGSPAIDAGDNGLIPPAVGTDRDGRTRVVNGIVDMGAYELQPGLYLQKTASHPFASPGQPITYTLRARNTFTDTAMTGAVISDTLPDPLEFSGPIHLDPPGAGTIGAAPPILVRDLTLDPGQIVTVTLPVTVGSGAALGAIFNVAAVTSTQMPVPQTASHRLPVKVCQSHATVSSDADSAPGSLRQAIASVCSGGVVDFALSVPATITLSSGELAITRSVSIAGPGPGLLAISGNGASRVFRVEALAGMGPIAVTLSGLTIRDGVADSGGGLWNREKLALVNVTFDGNTADHPGGGGMYNISSSTTLAGVTFSGNRAPGYDGGGMLNVQSSPALTDVHFVGNSSGYYGGGMHNEGGNPVLTDVTFDGNGAGGGGYGGGMSNDRGSPTLTGVIFSDNTAYNGGGMYNWRSSPTLTDVTFEGNAASSSGGGIYSQLSGGLTLTGVTFRGNTARYGGGMTNKTTSSTLANVIFSGNATSDSGGAIHNNSNSSPVLVNVILSGNSTGGHGGAMRNSDSSPTLTNVTFCGNWAGDSGGAMANGSSSQATIQNTILWGNDAGRSGDQIYNFESSTSIAYTDIEGCGGSGAGWDSTMGTDLGGNIDADPMFWSPVDPVDAPTTAGNLGLRSGSPAIDAGDNSLVPVGVITDLVGRPRIYNGVVDMGAYEAQSFTFFYLPVVYKGAGP